MLPTQRGTAHLTRCSSKVHICAVWLVSGYLRTTCVYSEGGKSRTLKHESLSAENEEDRRRMHSIWSCRICDVCLNMSRNEVRHTFELFFVCVLWDSSARHSELKRINIGNGASWWCWVLKLTVKSWKTRWKFMWKSYKAWTSWHVFITILIFCGVEEHEIQEFVIRSV